MLGGKCFAEILPFSKNNPFVKSTRCVKIRCHSCWVHINDRKHSVKYKCVFNKIHKAVGRNNLLKFCGVNHDCIHWIWAL